VSTSPAPDPRAVAEFLRAVAGLYAPGNPPHVPGASPAPPGLELHFFAGLEAEIVLALAEKPRSGDRLIRELNLGRGRAHTVLSCLRERGVLRVRPGTHDLEPADPLFTDLARRVRAK
jgi:hypothetical protein